MLHHALVLNDLQFELGEIEWGGARTKRESESGEGGGSEVPEQSRLERSYVLPV